MAAAKSYQQTCKGLLHAASFAMLLKGVVGGSVTTLVLFGVAAPQLGFPITLFSEGAAAGVGAIMGALVAFKS